MVWGVVNDDDVIDIAGNYDDDDDDDIEVTMKMIITTIKI